MSFISICDAIRAVLERSATQLSLGVSVVLLAASPTSLAQSRVYEATDHNFRLVTVAEGLEHPWSIAFLPDGDVLITERPGRLRIVRDGKLLPEPVEGVPKVRVGNQSGAAILSQADLLRITGGLRGSRWMARAWRRENLFCSAS